MWVAQSLQIPQKACIICIGPCTAPMSWALRPGHALRKECALGTGPPAPEWTESLWLMSTVLPWTESGQRRVIMQAPRGHVTDSQQLWTPSFRCSSPQRALSHVMLEEPSRTLCFTRGNPGRKPAPGFLWNFHRNFHHVSMLLIFLYPFSQ